jgi:hypothetical protein
MRRMFAATFLALAALAGTTSARAGDWGHYPAWYEGRAYHFDVYFPRVYVYPRVFYLPRTYAHGDSVGYWYPRSCCHPPYAYAAAFPRKGSVHRVPKRKAAK